MLQKLKALPSLERKFAYLLLASVVAFFVYLIFNLTSEVPNTAGIKVRYRLLNQLTTISNELHEPVFNEQKSGQFGNLSPSVNPLQVSSHESQVCVDCAII